MDFSSSKTDQSCISVGTNQEPDKCITWEVPKASIDVCVDILPFEPIICESYGTRPTLELTQIDGVDAVMVDNTYYVCDDATLTITITNYDPIFIYALLHTSMDITNDYPSKYATLNGDGTITVDVGNLLQGGTEYIEIGAYDPSVENQCISSLGRIYWENVDTTPTPILGEQITISNREYTYEILNSQSYSSSVIFDVIEGSEYLTFTTRYDTATETWYIDVTMDSTAPQGYETVIYVRAKDGDKCWSDKGSALFKALSGDRITAINYVRYFTQTFHFIANFQESVIPLFLCEVYWSGVVGGVAKTNVRTLISYSLEGGFSATITETGLCTSGAGISFSEGYYFGNGWSSAGCSSIGFGADTVLGTWLLARGGLIYVNDMGHVDYPLGLTRNELRTRMNTVFYAPPQEEYIYPNGHNFPNDRPIDYIVGAEYYWELHAQLEEDRDDKLGYIRIATGSFAYYHEKHLEGILDHFASLFQPD